jgi:hypothetical protein
MIDAYRAEGVTLPVGRVWRTFGDDFELSWPLMPCYAWVTPVELAGYGEAPTDAMSSAGSCHHIKRLLLLMAQGAHQKCARAQ